LMSGTHESGSTPPLLLLVACRVSEAISHECGVAGEEQRQ
jgi:hypothetical protein